MGPSTPLGINSGANGGSPGVRAHDISKDKRQKAKGKRQKAEGKREKAKDEAHCNG